MPKEKKKENLSHTSTTGGNFHYTHPLNPHPCPNCGYCPTCGRRNHYYEPYNPYYPYHPTYWITWNSGTTYSGGCNHG